MDILHEAEAEYGRLILEQMPGFVWGVDRELRIMFVRGAGFAALGTPVETTIGMTLCEYVGTDDPSFEPIASCLRAFGGEATTYEIDWAGRSYDTRLEPLRNASGEIIGALAFSADITERKHAEEDRARLAALVETSADAIASVGLDGMMTSWNAGAEQMLGYSANEVIGRSITRLLPPDRPTEGHDVIARIARGERIEQLLTKRRHKNGRLIDVAVSIAPIVDANGRVTGASAITRDITRELEGRARLRESEERLQAIVDNTETAIFVKDLEGRYLVANETAERLLSLAAGQMVGKTDHELLGIEGAEFVRARDARVLEERGSFTEEVTLDLAVGRRTFASERFPLLDLHGEPYAICGIASDITESKTAEAFAAGQTRVLEMIATAEPLEDVLTHLCHVVEERVGDLFCSVHLLEGGELRLGAAPSLPAEYNAAVARVPVAEAAGSCGTAAFRAEQVIVSDIAADPIWLDWRAVAISNGLHACWSTPIKGSADDVLGTFAIYFTHKRLPTTDTERTLIATATDIAGIAISRSRGEQELRRSEERYRGLFESANDIVMRVSLDEVILDANPAAERLFGRPRGELIGKPLSDFLSTEGFSLTREQSRRKLTGRESATTYEIDLLAGDGRVVAIEVSSRLVYEGGEPVAVEGIGRDLSERRALEERLRRAQRMESIGRLAGGIAHDFNNLLMAIRGYSELALTKLGAGESAARGDVEEITNAAERAAALTRQLLAFSRRQMLQLRVIDLNALVEEMKSLLERIIGEDVELVTRLDPELAHVKVDPGQIEQAIMNIAVNARDAMPHGGRLAITTENSELGELAEDDTLISDAPLEAGNYVRLVISDSGGGIDPVLKPRIFEPFFTTKEPGKGTGLGLSTVHGIVSQSGGQIAVSSVAGSGTTFSIYLPAVPEPIEPIERDGVRASDSNGVGTILLAEDEAVVRRLLCGALEESGYTVLDASDGHEALAIAMEYEGEIDVLVTDLVMPGMGGAELAEQLLSMRPQTRVIEMSGYTEDRSRLVVGNGRALFLQKPFPPSRLAGEIDLLLRGAELPREQLLNRQTARAAAPRAVRTASK